MFAWLSANFINLVLVAVIALVTGLLIRSLIRDKKAGKSSCGGNCASCGACSGCGSCAFMKKHDPVTNIGEGNGRKPAVP